MEIKRKDEHGLAGRALRLRIFCICLLPYCFALSSCQKPNNNNPAPSGDYQHGVWFINEGGFGDGDASLDFYHQDKDTVESNVFENVNGKPLGDVFQSMYRYNGSYYLVVNNSNELIVANDKSLKVSAVVPNIIYPRYFLPVSSQKAYITGIAGETIHILDLQSNTISGQIPYNPKPDSSWASWTEQMLQYGSKVYVAAVKTGKLLVINSNTDKITDSFKLSIGAANIVMDKQKRLWVMCDGTLATTAAASSSGIPSKLFCLDTSGHILQSYTFPDVSIELRNLTTNAAADTLYYIYGGIYKMGINEGALPAASFINGAGHVFYGLGVDPANGDIYGGDDLAFTQPGIVFQYSPAGKLLKTHHSGVGPNGFLFVP